MSASEFLQGLGGAAEAAGGIYKFISSLLDVANANVLATHFKFDGTRVAGSDKVAVSLAKSDSNPAVFWLSVNAFEDYAFVRSAVNPSGVYELIRFSGANSYTDPNVWRWVAIPPGVALSFEPPNAKVDFIVIAYRPSSLLNALSNKAP